jgi:hypothetical protein
MTYEYYGRHEEVKPLLDSQTPALGIKIIRVSLGIVKALKKYKLPPWENETYSGESISQYDQAGNN